MKFICNVLFILFIPIWAPICFTIIIAYDKEFRKDFWTKNCWVEVYHQMRRELIRQRQ